ncbi:hypothetical protein [Malikia spinosa]|uniref:hypothetical protein n=1 Tax=Malikia spinosa TaxID=86180 RepID=UPI0027B97ECB|nr:hypothetical protein [Malikia spinosa]
MSKNPHWTQGVPTTAIPLATLADLVLRHTVSMWLLAAACLVFMLYQRRYVAPGIRRTSLVLGLLTATLLPLIDHPLPALASGVRIGGLIASLLIAINLLSRASLRVPRMRQLVTDLFALPRRQRPLALGVGAQFLGGFLGLAGLTMMMDVAAQRQDVSKAEQIADFSAISRGYAALTLWSPMYSNMSIVLTLYEGIRWTDVLPYAFAISAIFIGLGALLESLKPRAESSGTLKPSSIIQLLRDSLPIVALMLCFVSGMVWASDRLHVSVSAIIIASVPFVAWLLNVWQPSEPTQRWRSGGRQLCQDLLGQSTMAGEVLLFLVSGCAGTVFSQAIPVSWIEAVAQLTGGSPYWGSLLVMAAIVGWSGTSMHPMLSAVLVGSSLTPAVLGMPPLVHLCSVLVGWGLAIITTPFSVLSLMAARFSGIPILVISLRANLAFVLVSMGGAALVLGWIVTPGP